ncbi:MAG: Re/Si-specific NAD(P)(+) transhydrogenase subunit alpha [Bacteroidetes bacterium]|nr:Re/Si-specific NAD(P)(+) transhydrogenase subunit alpha [Bacteroidota bacterium]MBU1422552.1 Re/Si-specific NAD(P)(+) transhydrogenase subunit alpha [Bacteroidota bacterium]MBU2471415.1 Re/Si-specific NAD(P)(+) transhydrogenase subunit alpha [Bacteroidota bacterium]
MKIGILKELIPDEARVALVPSTAAQFVKDGHEVLVESRSGERASFADAQFEKVGARIIASPSEVYDQSDLLIRIHPLTDHPQLGKHEGELLRESAAVVGFMSPFSNRNTIETFVRRRITSFSMEFIPRSARAQSMDALSSMATIAGYKAVLLAANHLKKIFPLMMTAAGTIHPSTVLILGAGVAGLQAIATAKRLGARVEAFDPRPVVKEQVQSLGASFVEMELPKDAETEQGYAKELSAEFLKMEQEAIASRLPKVDVVISTAQVFGKRPPILITNDMLKLLRPGSVIVDLAAEQGGNCEATKSGETLDVHGITVIGAVNLPSTLPVHASELYARNVTNFIRHVYQQKNGAIDFNDDIVKSACLTHNGEIVNQLLRQSTN